MNNTFKMVLALVVAIALLPMVALAEEDGAMVASPMTDYETYVELLEDTGIPLADAPVGATDVTYASIDGEPFLAQVAFTLDDSSYTYRAAYAENEEIAAAMTDYVHGVFMEEPQVEERPLEGTDINYQAITDGQEVMVYSWFLPEMETQYSLFCATGAKDGEAAMQAVLVQMLEIPQFEDGEE